MESLSRFPNAEPVEAKKSRNELEGNPLSTQEEKLTDLHLNFLGFKSNSETQENAISRWKMVF